MLPAALLQFRAFMEQGLDRGSAARIPIDGIWNLLPKTDEHRWIILGRIQKKGLFAGVIVVMRACAMVGIEERKEVPLVALIAWSTSVEEVIP